MSTPLLLAALKVLVLAGGASPAENHHSHKVHVDALVALLAERGVPAGDVAVFWADGSDPAADRAVVAEAPAADEWLIEGTRLDLELSVAPALVDTRFDRPVQPATRAALQAWLRQVGPTLGPRDTLLVAVTDHGVPDPDGGAQVAISLWGEEWSVDDFAADLAPVPVSTRVVLWMSQCFSGGFAELHRRRPNLCGAFAAHPDRPAYGCHPRLAGKDDVGHFLRMVEALARHGTLAAAHDEVLVTDDTPDTPHLTSDVMLFEAIDAEAGAVGATAGRFIDARLPRDTQDPAWALLSAVATRYGLGAVARYEEAMALIKQLDEARYALGVWGERWYEADVHARGLLAEPLVRVLRPTRDRATRIEQRARAVTAMRKLWSEDAALRARLARLRAKVEAARALEAQIEVQEAAAIRAAYVVSRLAGAQAVGAATRARYAELRACEAAPLIPAGPVAVEVPVAAAALPAAAAVPGAVEALRPGWFGLGYRDAPKHAGVVVERFLPGSPGFAAGLAVDDRIAAVDGWTLRRRGGFREAALLAQPGAAAALTVKRGRRSEELRLWTAPMPLPDRPPALTRPVPLLGVVPYDAKAPLPTVGEGRSVVLFFWEPGAARSVAAMPALAAWAERHGAAVMAITGESGRTVGRFAAKRRVPFPIALDPEGNAARLFAVEERPVFVLVDAEGLFVDEGEGFEGTIPLRGPQGE
ncbi:MAG: redoxin domain-containing protein [Myxococcales bacterium]|nr:redoxin domain-containing protein [Myxococcales bacterium]